MVGVQLSGGLGNQMFEYALYLKLKSMGKDVRIDDVTCYVHRKSSGSTSFLYSALPMSA